MGLVLESAELEHQILFLCYKYQDSFQKIVSDLHESSFSNNIHRKIYNFLTRIKSENKSISIQASNTVMQSESDNEIEKLSINAAFEKISKSPAKLEDYIAISDQLKRFETTRKFLKSVRTTTDDLCQNTVLEEGLDKLEKDIQRFRNRLVKVSDLTHMRFKEDLQKRIDYSHKVKSDPALVGLIQTGFRNFDNFLPAIPQGSMYLYMARPNIGKSMFLMGTALHNHNVMGARVVVITIEMSAREYLFRMDSNVTGFEQKAFVTGDITTDPTNIEIWKEKVSRFGTKKNPHDIDVFWVPENCTPKKLVALISSLNYKPDLIIVDYAGDMDCDDPKLSKYDPKAQALVYDGLKNLAQKFECVVFSAQQIKRGEGKKSADTESGYGSDKGAQRADGVISLKVTEEDKIFEDDKAVDGFKTTGRITIEYTKNRQGALLRTYVKPLFIKMDWFEPPFDEPEYAKNGAKKVKEKSNPLSQGSYQNVEDVKNSLEIPMEDTPSQMQMGKEERQISNAILDNLI